MHVPKIMIKRDSPLHEPSRAHPTDAGADLRSTEMVEIPPGEQYLVDTGVAVAIPPRFVGLLFNRSSQGKKGLVIPNSVGVIDSDYRGNIKVLLKNTTFDNQCLVLGERVAQLVIVPIILPMFEVFKGTDEEWKTSTARGTGGFGSTGQ